MQDNFSMRSNSLHFVGPLIFALVLTKSLGVSLAYVIAFFLWGMASHAFGAIQDIIPDREAKLASIATVFGARATALLTLSLYGTSSLIVMLQGFPAAIIGFCGLLYVANTLPFLSITDQTSATANKGWRRFIWLNYIVGFTLTVTLILASSNANRTYMALVL